MRLACTGNQLPDIPTVNCTDATGQLENCCLLMQIDDQVLMYDQPDQAYYWVLLQADEIPLVICNLEKYADQAEKVGNWTGRRSDYLVMGMNTDDGDCYLVIVELRHIITNEDQVNDKLEQLQNSIKQVMSRLEIHLANSPLFEQACPKPEHYKVVGIVIAPAGIKAFSRLKRTRTIIGDTYQGIITMMPSERIKECKITWTELLKEVVPKNDPQRFKRH